MTRIKCLICSKLFIKKPNQKYCSTNCAKKAQKEINKIAQKKYRESKQGKEKNKNYQKKYYSIEENRQKRRENTRKYLKSNKGLLKKREISKKQYLKFRDKYLDKNKKWAEENKERHKKMKSDYRKTEIYKFKRAQWEKKEREINPRFKLERNIRSRLYHFLKRHQMKKKTKTFKYIGCTPSELKIYLEKKFKPGMNWQNYGKWHIDHVKPLSMFDITNEKELYVACNFKNLQPMWALENVTKGNRRIG